MILTVTLNPAVVVNGGTTSLNVDFNLATSLTQDTSGNFTFNPQITVTANAVPAGGGIEHGHVAHGA